MYISAKDGLICKRIYNSTMFFCYADFNRSHGKECFASILKNHRNLMPRTYVFTVFLFYLATLLQRVLDFFVDLVTPSH